MGSSGRRFILMAVSVVSLAAAGPEPAAGDPAPTPLTIRGATATAAAPDAANGAPAVLRGSRPIPPPVAIYACPDGDTAEEGVGCVSPGYQYQQDYGGYWPYLDFAGSGRAPRPHRHAAARFGRGFDARGVPGRR